MRISDWSSDVCSSDLVDTAMLPEHRQRGPLVRLRALIPGRVAPPLAVAQAMIREGSGHIGCQRLAETLDATFLGNELVQNHPPATRQALPDHRAGRQA